MSESYYEDAAKAAVGQANVHKPKRAPLWMRIANGRVYRVSMRVMHRLGWCYPERTLVSESGVWCHWCGMRGKRVLPPTAEQIAAMREAPHITTGPPASPCNGLASCEAHPGARAEHWVEFVDHQAFVRPGRKP